MIRDVEDAFRAMKSDLGLRPVRHHTENRADGHLFITALACHPAYDPLQVETTRHPRQLVNHSGKIVAKHPHDDDPEEGRQEGNPCPEDFADGIVSETNLSGAGHCRGSRQNGKDGFLNLQCRKNRALRL